MPHLSHIEEEGSAKDIIEEEPQGIIVLEKPVTDCRKEQYDPMKVANSLDEMHQDISRKEGKQEPKRAVSEDEAVLEPVKLLYFSYCLRDSFGEKAQPEECQNEAYRSPRQVRNEETTHSVAQVRQRLARNALVEVACFKEEETHEEEGPEHCLLPPRSPSKLCLADDMQHHHSQDAESA